ncbi:member 38 [Blastocladiella emersonii ATCC 22665]|nr:member 38 [Blastocladiella emersonii ATCC 22665]
MEMPTVFYNRSLAYCPPKIDGGNHEYLFEKPGRRPVDYTYGCRSNAVDLPPELGDGTFTMSFRPSTCNDLLEFAVTVSLESYSDVVTEWVIKVGPWNRLGPVRIEPSKSFKCMVGGGAVEKRFWTMNDTPYTVNQISCSLQLRVTNRPVPTLTLLEFKADVHRGTTYYSTPAYVGKRVQSDHVGIRVHLSWSTSQEYDATLLESLNNADFCDVSFLVGDAKLPVHASRGILAARSPFFGAMFRGDWAESTDAKSTDAKSPVLLPTWHRASFALIVMHLYTKWVPVRSDIPEPIAAALTKFDVCAAEFDSYEVLINCIDLTAMLELPKLCSALKPKLMDALDARMAAASVSAAE